MNLTEWAHRHGNPMTTVDPSAEWTELEPLADLVGSARVVALGESAHHVRELYQLRHRMTRFLVERCGFTVIVLGPRSSRPRPSNGGSTVARGSVAQIAHEGIAMALGDCRQLHEQLEWMRAHNRRPTSGGAVTCVGVDLPGSRPPCPHDHPGTSPISVPRMRRSAPTHPTVCAWPTTSWTSDRSTHSTAWRTCRRATAPSRLRPPDGGCGGFMEVAHTLRQTLARMVDQSTST